MTLPAPVDRPSAASESPYDPPVVLATFSKADLVEDLPEDLTPHIHTVQNS